jgi:hypothetical protein
MVEQFIGSKKYPPEYRLTSINGYAYLTLRFNFSHILRVISHFPFKIKNLILTSEQRWREQSRPAYIQTIERWESEI